MHCLVRLDTQNYGYVISKHDSHNKACDARAERCQRVLNKYPDALTHHMYRIVESEAECGDRIRIA